MSRQATVSPHNLEAEESLLGACLLSLEAIEVTYPHLAPEDFYDPKHGRIWEAILNLHTHGFQCDPVTVASELERMGQLEMVGGSIALVRLQAGTPGVRNADHYALIVSKASRARSALVGLDEAQRAVRDGVDPDMALMDLFNQTAAGGGARSTWDPIDLDDLWDSPAGLSFPPGVILKRGDGEHLLSPGALGILVAPPESGKSMLSMAAVVECALAGRHAIYVDFESSAERVVPRLRQHIDGHEAREFFHYVRPKRGMSAVDRWKARRLVARLNPRFVVLDGYNALIAKHKRKSNDSSDIADIAEEVIEPWRADDTCVLLIDHVSKEEKRFGGTDPMGSVSKLGLVDYSIYLRRDENARFVRGGVGTVTLEIAKDRDGELRGLCLDRHTFGQFNVRSSTAGRWEHRVCVPDGMTAPPVYWRPQSA